MNRETMGHFAAKFDESCIVAGAKNAHESLNLGPAIVSFPDLSVHLSNCKLFASLRGKQYFSFETFTRFTIFRKFSSLNFELKIFFFFFFSNIRWTRSRKMLLCCLKGERGDEFVKRTNSSSSMNGNNHGHYGDEIVKKRSRKTDYPV